MHTTILVKERDSAKWAAHESEQRYKRLLTSVTDYVYTVTIFEGRPISTLHGPGCEAVTGYTPDEFQSDPLLWHEMIFTDDRTAVTKQAEQVLHGETPLPLDHRIRHKDGRLRWIRNTAVPHKDEFGTLVAYDGLVKDITERKRAEQFLAIQYTVSRELSESPGLDEALARVLESIATTFRCFLWDAAMFWQLDPNQGVMRCEQAWHAAEPCLMEFYSASRARKLSPGMNNLPGRVLATGEAAWVTDAEVEEADSELGSEARRAGIRGTCAFPVRRGKQLVGAVELFSREAQPFDGEMLRVLLAVGDQIGQFMERKQAELALRQSQERLELVIQGSSDGIWDWDLITNAVYFSPRWKNMLGYADNELEDHYSAWERLLHPSDRERALSSLQAYLDGQVPTYEVEHRLRHKNGSYRWILARGAALRDASGKAIRLAGSHVDVTAHKQAEQQLERAYAELSQNEAALKSAFYELRAANKEVQMTQLQLIQAAKLETVGTLAASVAHEVKNPLQTIVMGLDYLDNNIFRREGNNALVLTDMRDAVTRANEIVRELLQLSAAKDFEPKPGDLNAVVKRSLWLINSEVIASQVNVARQLADELPNVKLDRNKMEQVFINLFLNSLQAMSPNGVLTVTTRKRRFGEDLKLGGPAFENFNHGDMVVIAEVQDTGSGIPEPHLPRIFDPFYTTKPTGAGTGLGLSVVKKIMDLHKAGIDIRNHPLGGVVVTLVFRAEPETSL